MHYRQPLVIDLIKRKIELISSPKVVVGEPPMSHVPHDSYETEEAKPRTKAEILDLLRGQGEQFAAWLETLTPEFLAETVIVADGASAETRFSSHSQRLFQQPQDFATPIRLGPA
jgi:hypothetical protein